MKLIYTVYELNIFSCILLFVCSSNVCFYVDEVIR